MPRKPNRRNGGRNRRNFVAIPFDFTVTVGALVPGAIAVGSGITFGEDIFIISVDCVWSIYNHTAGEGPLKVGFAHGQLSSAEIIEALQAEQSSPDMIVEKEHARRPVRIAGVFSGISTEENLNMGTPLRTKVRFSIGNGYTPDFWILNRDAAPLTPGTILTVDGVIYGRWQR